MSKAKEKKPAKRKTELGIDGAYVSSVAEVKKPRLDGPQISVDRQVVNSLRDAVRRYGLTPTQIDGIRDPVSGHDV
eukprot:6491166-Amphidinium_carterae.1